MSFSTPGYFDGMACGCSSSNTNILGCSGVTSPLLMPGPRYLGVGEYIDKLCEAHLHAKHAKFKGIWGHAPKEKFENLDPLRLNLRAFLTI